MNHNNNIIPEIPDCYPRVGNSFTRWFGKSVFGAMGWSINGTFPAINKAILAIAPHTSNMDFVVGIFAKFAIGTRIHWIGKDSLFVWPAKYMFTHWGGIPVCRTSPQGVVDQLVESFKQHDKLLLVITPEGTRKKTEKLKTGFIRIAHTADIPIFPIGFDFGKKRIELGELFYASGDVEKDERELRDYFKRFKGYAPENYCD
ncbi:1-acyl-sn-glycerol-3-phosphate acyltransferase [Gynuella sunshinyii]|uniref:1-acyl-sn-glycerol-3-phosphate acyltransferase n=1 Tax=Gynuella sunshinyii YC6258 TaxID=1445510 RepID=A0A0C5VSS2_9GAMM|nr:1-acyl-sn-glycerol-3-phosphate acyltransferase [Gynuella sunshinyii]AJQ96393.1 1-acyl-sn-glycerol-3-phosphate acyltransferase [Gynuella sunshinyii YC6258]